MSQLEFRDDHIQGLDFCPHHKWGDYTSKASLDEDKNWGNQLAVYVDEDGIT